MTEQVSLRVALLGHSSTHEEFTYAFGLYRLAAYCRSLDLPHAVQVFDRSAADSEDEDFALLSAHRPHVVGLSAFLWSLPRVVRLVARLKSLDPCPLIVVGGPSAQGFDDLAAAVPRPDLLVIGFGEQTFANILRAHAQGRLEDEVALLGHIVRFREGRRASFPGPPPPQSLDVFPSAYLDGHVDLTGHKTLYVETDRGCPYSCAFCIESTAPPKVARFSLARVEAELSWALARGFENIELCSAILNLDTAWLDGFVTMVERIDPRRRLSFSAALFTTHLTEQQAPLLGRLQLKSALFGLNSVNPATFKAMRRVIRPEQFREKIELFARYSRPQVSLIMGLPGDTAEGLRQTLQFAVSLPADVMLFRFMVLPNTIYYEQRERLQLEIDYQHDNRILSTFSYSRQDMQRMEAIAACAGFDEVSPGEWVRRESQDGFRPAGVMQRKKWNLLYLTLQRLDVAGHAWPEGWRHERVFLDVPRYAGLSFRGARGEQLNLYLAEDSTGATSFCKTRLFLLAFRAVHAAGSAGPQAEQARRALLDAFAAAFAKAERATLRAAASGPALGPAAGRAPGIVDADVVGDQALESLGNLRDETP